MSLSLRGVQSDKATVVPTGVIGPIADPEVLDPLQQILEMPNQDIFRNGVPLDNLRVWRDRFYQGLEDHETSVMKFSRESAWAYEPDFFKTKEKQVEMGFDENGAFFLRKSTHRDHFVSAFHQMMHPAFWNESSMHVKMLVSLYRLHRIMTFPGGDPTEKVFIKLLGCLAERIAETKNGDLFSIALPDSQNNEVARHKRLCCFKTASGWRVGEFDAFPGRSLHVARFNTNNSEVLVLDAKGNLLDHSCTVIESCIRPEPDILTVNLVKVNMVLYSGPKAFVSGQRNAVTFTFDIDRTVAPLQMQRFRQEAPWITDPSECVTQRQLEHIKQEAELLLETFGPKLLSVRSYSAPEVFELTPPRSASDKLWFAVYLLTELQKNPDANADLIVAIAEKLDCRFTNEELQELEADNLAESTTDGYVVSPAAVAEKLLVTAKAQLAIAMKPVVPAEPVGAKEEPVESKSVTSGEDEASDSKAEEERQRFMEQRRLEKEVEKARRREAFEFEQRKAVARAQVDQEAAAAVSSKDLSMFGLSERDQRQVRAIYDGRPMNAKNFASFSMGLLRKKASALGAEVQKNVVGSHPKLHFKRTDGSSGGVTFRIHHGGDDHGLLSAQKDTLDRILDF